MQTEMTFGVDQAAVDRVTVQLIGIGRLGVAFSPLQERTVPDHR